MAETPLIFTVENAALELTQQHFNIDYWMQKKDSVLLEGGRGASVLFYEQGNKYVLRRYLRGGLMAKITQNLYFWSGIESSRVYQENKVLEYATAKGLPVAPCLGYCIERSGVFYQQAIITQYVENTGTLASLLEQKELASELWYNLAKAIKNMHQLNINHADLNANNILLTQDNQCCLIDFDKAQIMSGAGGWSNANIQRLLRSLHKLKLKHFTQDQWHIFMRHYSDSK